MNICRHCGRTLTQDEIALHKKLVNRGADTFLCITCLGRRFAVEESLLREKIEQFRRDGCTLFCTHLQDETP